VNLALFDLDNAPRSGSLQRRLSTQSGRSHNTWKIAK